MRINEDIGGFMPIRRKLPLKTVEEMEKLLQMAEDQIFEGGSKYPGMTYEQGIEAVLMWLWGDGEHPLED
jgi:hypothetical protein